MRTLWLSHPFDERTPLYGGGEGIEILQHKSISRGDSCNTTHLSFPGHAGTHVDTPRHFRDNGKNIDDYLPEEWIFNTPSLVTVAAGPGDLIGPEILTAAGPLDNAADLLLIRTGFERFRPDPLYWQNSPGLDPELADFFSDQMPALRAIGIDFISIASLSNRQAGRTAHRVLLGKGYRLFEDMSLQALGEAAVLVSVTALPLRVTGSDGVPCTIIGTAAL